MEAKVKSWFKKKHNGQQRILEDPHKGEASEFYFACRNGDIDKVKQMLPIIPYHQLNQLEPNGSTALHAATYFGHLDIVRLLLHEYGSQRHLRNRHGFTAYEEAETDEMRQLYHRPSGENRFNDDSMVIKEAFEIISLATNKTETDGSDDDDNAKKPDERYFISYEKNEMQMCLDGLSGVKALFQSPVGRSIMKNGMKLKLCKGAGYSDEEYKYVTSKKYRHDALKKVLDEHVPINHPDYQQCCELLKEYIQQGTIESLFTLYTMDTPFYRQSSMLSNTLGFPFFFHLADLKQRYYQGYSYRGTRLTRDKLNEYRWALKNKDSILSPLTFASTSMVRDVAEDFADKPSSSSSDKIRTIFIYHFPQPCDTAINLSEIPEYKLPCISFFKNEQEILVGPRTYFKVTKIEPDQCKEQYTIYLENLCGEQKTVLQAIKILLGDDMKNKTSKKLRD
ncbi:unnamed protein product [Rotaria socialis]|uniref:Uncharacterized protein n=1 Tax=Rotaria socialis TaxID=392032 RepID=A0A820IRV9_9BILA|nr:unnamed protein product [Rotaria socialis]CAF4313667.1 unnamed protein product [Rotaria socialis]